MNNISSEYILVLVTSNMCGHCVSFKEQYLSKLINNIKGIDNLTFLHINLPKNDTKGFFNEPVNKDIFEFVKGKPSRINPRLGNAIQGYPSIFLFSMKDWQSTDKLQGLYFNGSIIDSIATPASKDTVIIPRTADKIYDWVIQNMKNYNTSLESTKTPSVGSQPTTSNIPSNGSSYNSTYNSSSYNNSYNSTYNNSYGVPNYLKPSSIKIKIGPRDED